MHSFFPCELAAAGPYITEDRGIYITQHITAEHIISVISETASEVSAHIASEQIGKTHIVSEPVVTVIGISAGAVRTAEFLARIRSPSSS